MRYHALLLLSGGACLCATLRAQDGSNREFVTGTFAGTQVVNSSSVEVIPRKRSFGFMIQHRFGAFGPDGSAWKQFLGLDLPANIRFAFQYAPIKIAHLEVGRSKNGKVWDLGAKVRVLRQTVGNEMPLSLTLLANAAWMDDELPTTGDRYFLADGTTPYVQRYEHRLSYTAQAIVARKFTSRLSAQVATVFIHRNLVPVGHPNQQVVIPIAVRAKLTPKGSVLFEVAPSAYGRPPGQELVPWALAYELATQGHVFQVILCTGQEIIDQRSYATASSRYDEGYMHLGFNISRVLFVKPKQRHARSER